MMRSLTVIPKMAVGIVCIMVLLAVMGCEPKKVTSTGEFQSISVPFSENHWQVGKRAGKEIVTDHYRIYTTCGESRQAVLPGFMEAAYKNYGRILDISNQPKQPMPMYMLATRDQWAQLTDSLFGKFSAPSMRIEDGAYTLQGVTVCWAIGRRVMYHVAAHEGMHQYVHYTFRHRLPRWAEEGLATAAEGFDMTNDSIRFTPRKNIIRTSDLQQAIVHGQWMSMKELLTTNTLKALDGGQVKGLGYYGQLYALAQFLKTHPDYQAKWNKFLQDAVAGRLQYRRYPVQQFSFYFTEDLDGFEKEYLAFSRQISHLDK